MEQAGRKEVDHAPAHGAIHGDLGVWPAGLPTMPAQEFRTILVARWLLIAWASVLVLFLALMRVTQ